jgi:hypothetical protein
VFLWPTTKGGPPRPACAHSRLAHHIRVPVRRLCPQCPGMRPAVCPEVWPESLERGRERDGQAAVRTTLTFSFIVLGFAQWWEAWWLGLRWLTC